MDGRCASAHENRQDLSFSFVNQQPQAQEQEIEDAITDLTLPRDGEAGGGRENARREIPDTTVKAAVPPEAGQGARATNIEDVLALSDDDFDLKFVKNPAPKGQLLASKISSSRPGAAGKEGVGAMLAGKGAPGKGAVGGGGGKAGSGTGLGGVQGYSQGLEQFPSNHYEDMLQSRQLAPTEEEDPWDRALLPATGAANSTSLPVPAAGLAKKDSSSKKGTSKSKKDSKSKSFNGGGGIVPFFGGGGGGDGGVGGEKGKKDREQNKCSICQQPGHSKRTCPFVEEGEGGGGGGGEKKKRKKGLEEAEEIRQSTQDKMESLSSVATNVGMANGAAGLEELLLRVSGCSCIVFGIHMCKYKYHNV